MQSRERSLQFPYPQVLALRYRRSRRPRRQDGRPSAENLRLPSHDPLAHDSGRRQLCPERALDAPSATTYARVSSMSHLVEENVNRNRIRDLLRKMLEEVMVIAFPLPTVSVVGVVSRDHHHAPFVVVNRAMMNLAAFFPIVVLPCDSGVFASRPELNVRNLPLRFYVEDAMIQRMIEQKFLEIAVWKNFFQFVFHIRPLPLTPKIIQHQKPPV